MAGKRNSFSSLGRVAISGMGHFPSFDTAREQRIVVVKGVLVPARRGRQRWRRAL
jgi:hypothetical protein